MKNSFFKFLALCICICTAEGCDLISFGPQPPVQRDSYSQVVVYYGGGFNDLSFSLQQNVNDLCKGAIPSSSSDKALFIFLHRTKSGSSQYSTDNPPAIARAYTMGSRIVLDTLYVFPEGTRDTDASTISTALGYIRSNYKSDHYGLIYSSHGTGWLPEYYYDSYEGSSIWTESIGAEYTEPGKWQETELADFAAALPMKFDFIIMDACLMGGIETAYELKDKCRYLVASPTEVISEGFYYDTMAERLFSGKEPDLKGVCRDIAEHRSKYTISLVDCSKLESTASACKAIIGAHRAGLEAIDRNSVQKFFRGGHSWFYDLRDIFSKCGSTGQEMNALDSALKDCVLFVSFSETFLSIDIKTCCGMSMYIPDKSWTSLNDHYKTLEWNKAVNLVE